MARPKGSKNKIHHQVTLVCDSCGKEFKRYPCWIEKNISRGITRKYCSRACQAIGRSKEWAKKISGENSPHWKGGSGSYRKRAIEKYGLVCEKCGYDGTKFPGLMWIHHKNFKTRKEQDNHSLDNLQVLCIRCHLEEHYAIQIGEAQTLDVGK